APPGAAARMLELRPEPRVVGQVGVGAEVRARRPRLEDVRALLGAEARLAVADQVHTPLEAVTVHDDLDEVAVQHLADRPAGERLGADVADARARGDAGEARIGDHRDVLAPREVLERGRDLIDLFHPRPHRPAAGEHEHVPRLQPVRPLALDRRDSRTHAHVHARITVHAADYDVALV